MLHSVTIRRVWEHCSNDGCVDKILAFWIDWSRDNLLGVYGTKEEEELTYSQPRLVHKPLHFVNKHKTSEFTFHCNLLSATNCMSETWSMVS